MNQIILRFDETLALKLNKKSLQDYQDEVEEDYMLKKHLDDFKQSIKVEQQVIQSRVEYLDDIVKNQTKTFERQMFTNIRNAVDGI